MRSARRFLSFSATVSCSRSFVLAAQAAAERDHLGHLALESVEFIAAWPDYD